MAVVHRMTDHSKKEMKLFRRQNVKLKETYDKNFAELTKLKQAHETAMKELEFLREKDKAFNEADVLREHLANRIAALENENQRMSDQVDENEFQLRVLRKENAQLKDDLLHVDENFAKAREEMKRLEDKCNRLEVKAMQCQAKAEEDVARF